MGTRLSRRRVILNEEPAYARGTGFYDPYVLNPHVTVVGAGGIGGWVVMQLGKMGVRRFTLYDDDVVARHNLSNTPYFESDRGKPKVEALKKLVLRMNPEAQIKTVAKRYTGQSFNSKTEILISAVDSMAARKVLFDQAVAQKVPFFIDGRIGGERLNVYSIQPKSPDDRMLYRASWFSDDKVAPLPCSMQQTIYVGNLIGARITHAVQRWTTRHEYTPELIEELRPITLWMSEVTRVQIPARRLRIPARRRA